MAPHRSHSSPGAKGAGQRRKSCRGGRARAAAAPGRSVLVPITASRGVARLAPNRQPLLTAPATPAVRPAGRRRCHAGCSAFPRQRLIYWQTNREPIEVFDWESTIESIAG